MSLLVANKDVRGLLMQFGGTSGYNLNPNRIDDFVQRLVSYKEKGGNINDFNPFMHGVQVGWARTEGYFGTKQFTTQEVTDVSETTDVQLQPRGGALSAEAKAFYASAGAAQVNAILAGASEGAKQKAYDCLANPSERAQATRNLAGLTVSGRGADMKVTITGDNERAKKWLRIYARR
jgi:hypothetical protein